MPASSTVPIPPLPVSFADWLIDNNSLTLHLKQLCRQFEVTVLSEGFNTVAENGLELPLDLISLEPTAIWQREVVLKLDGIAWVYALTQIPQHALADQHDFAQLGTRPLGEVLFTDPTIQRGRLRLTQHDHHSRAAQVALSCDQPIQAPLSGRCREFHLPSGTLTVHEVFLPFAEQQLSALAHRQTMALAL